MTTDLLALFPLGTVLVPGQTLPLHIFEPRYRTLIRELIDGPERPGLGRAFGVVAIREGHEVGAHAARALYDIGTAARLESVQPLDDGRYDVMTVGTRRFRIEELDDTAPYLRASVTWLDEATGDDAAVIAPSVRRQLLQYRDDLADAGVLDPVDPDDITDDPTSLSYVVAAAMILDLRDRQAVLEQPDDSARLRLALQLLRQESAMARHLPSLPAGDLARTDVSLN